MMKGKQKELRFFDALVNSQHYETSLQEQPKDENLWVQYAIQVFFQINLFSFSFLFFPFLSFLSFQI